MARPAADSVKVEWTGTGTGTMSLGSAVAAFQGFPPALDSQVVSYSIEHQTEAERENGLGTYTLSGNTLSRDFVTFSTNGGARVGFTDGTKHVRLAALSPDIVEYRDTVDPTATDDINSGFIRGRSRWLNTATPKLFFLLDDSAGAANWQEVGVGGGGSATTFAELTDTPSSYAGAGNRFVSVNAGETGLEFVTAPGGGDMLASTYDPQTIAADAFARANHTGTEPNSAITQASVTQHQGAIDHDALANFVADAHVAHSGVSITAGTGLTGGGTIATSRTLNLANTAVTPASYTNANITVDQQGRITAASDGTAGGSGDAEPTQVESSGADPATHVLADAERAHLQVEVHAHQAGVDFDVPSNTGQAWWTIHAHDMLDGTPYAGCTVSVAGDVGSVNGNAGGSRRIAPGGSAFIKAINPAGSAPIVTVFGDVFNPPDTRGALDPVTEGDHGKIISVTGNQTFPTVANFPPGFEAAYEAEGASRSLVGLAGTHVVPQDDMVIVRRTNAGKLVAVGNGGPTTLDAP